MELLLWFLQWQVLLKKAMSYLYEKWLYTYPQEIENALMQDSRVKDVLAYGTKENNVTRIGIKIKGNFYNTKEVKEMCIKLLPTYQVPNLIEIVD